MAYPSKISLLAGFLLEVILKLKVFKPVFLDLGQLIKFLVLLESRLKRL